MSIVLDAAARLASETPEFRYNLRSSDFDPSELRFFDMATHRITSTSREETNFLSRLFGVEIDAPLSVSIQEARRFNRMELESGDSVGVGVAVRMIAAATASESMPEFTMQNLAAAAQLGKRDARAAIQVIGYSGNLGHLLPPPVSLNLDTYFELKQSFEELQREVFQPGSEVNYHPQIIEYKQKNLRLRESDPRPHSAEKGLSITDINSTGDTSIGRAEGSPPLRLLEADRDGNILPEDLLLRRVYYGTNRRKTDDVTSHACFGRERGKALVLGYTDVSIPKDRIPGTIDRPERLRIWKIPLPIREKEDIKKHFVEYATKELSEEEFKAEISNAAQRSEAGYSAMVYIHGFNNSFQQAMFRAAQLGEDLKFDGLVFGFSWPARGGVLNYLTDLDSARLAVRHLDRFLSIIGEEPNIQTVHLIAHSMGNELLANLVERAGTALSERQGMFIDQLILAAPDVDREAFEQVSEHFMRHSTNVTLYASSKDIALNVSENIRAAYPRAGDVPSDGPLVVDGIDTMDVSAVESGLFELKHSTYGDSDRVINDVLQRMGGIGKPADKRFTDVERVNTPEGGFYYKFKPVRR
ncbi:MAG: alpha/beta hydrolase [Pseudomonadota bacterium]